MKSITIHKLEDRVVAVIERIANQEGSSLNKTIKRLLASAVGLGPEDKDKNQKEFSDLFGVWSEEEFKDFQKGTQDFAKTDPKDWK